MFPPLTPPSLPLCVQLVFSVVADHRQHLLLSGSILAVTRPPAIQVSSTTFLKMSLSYIGAMLLSNWALSYMTYPAQSLAKSCKLIPVMLMRIVINQARYEVREYIQVGAHHRRYQSVFMAYQEGEGNVHSGGVQHMQVGW